MITTVEITAYSAIIFDAELASCTPLYHIISMGSGNVIIRDRMVPVEWVDAKDYGKV